MSCFLLHLLLGLAVASEPAGRLSDRVAEVSERGTTLHAPLSTAEAGARLDGAVQGYVALALEQSPAVAAAFHTWEASVHDIARARSFPEPVLSVAAFAQSVETRVGPQLARLSLQQAFPWPTTLTAGADARSSQARAEALRVEAVAIAVGAQVEQAYWALWEVRATREVHRDHLSVLDGLSETTRARLEVGAATLADLQQIDLTRARLRDRLRGMDEAERRAGGALRAIVALAVDATLPTTSLPSAPALPADDLEALIAAAQAHPGIGAVRQRAGAADAGAKVAAARRAPTFTVGVDWIITGDAPMPGVADSGKDAVAIGLGVKLPLWQGSYRHGVDAARARAGALLADAEALDQAATRSVVDATARIDDTARRVLVTRDTLLPQADAAYGSVLSGFASGRSAVAQTLLAQRDLLELRVELTQARAEHARAWSTLRGVCGRDLPSTPVELAAFEETP